jgi:hypothetical protein
MTDLAIDELVLDKINEYLIVQCVSTYMLEVKAQVVFGGL